jgi:hypothetical protein
VSAGRFSLAPYTMALVRALAGWLILARPLALLAGPAFAAYGTLPRYALAVLLGAGLLAFAYPKSCLWGLLALLAGLAAFALWWRALGGAPGLPGPSAFAVLAVLGAGEWLTRRLARPSTP